MKRKICGLLFAVGAFLIWGIFGGIEFGEHWTNALWIIPIALVMWAVERIGKLFE